MLALVLASCAAALAGSVELQSSARKPKPDASKSIAYGLAWLARHQNPDGSWGGNRLRQRCQAGPPCFDERADLTGHYDEGLTGLAVLAYLHGGALDRRAKPIVDPSSGEKLDAAKIVGSGLAWLKKTQRKSGSFGRDRPFLYNDAIGTMAMAEAFVATQEHAWKECAAKGADFLQDAQRMSPIGDRRWGWRYTDRMFLENLRPVKKTQETEEAWKKELHDSDVSATGWAIAALSSAAGAGIHVDEASLSGALDFLNFATNTNGLVGYLDAETAGAIVTGPFDQYRYHVAAMSSIGVLIRSSTSKDWTNPFFDRAAREILKDLPEVSSGGLSIDYYYWYHATLAMERIEGSEGPKKAKRKVSAPWNKAVLETLSDLQDREKGSCGFGGWIVPDRWNLYAGGPVYATAMCVLTLEALSRE